jgi:hypothetical protein
MIALLCTASLRAQVTTITPSVTMGVGRDDNVFWLPTSVSDRFWRVTPALTIGVESPQSAWLGTYNFDAEQYATYQSLSNAQARRHGSVVGRIRSSPTTVVTLAGGYESSVVPAELNATTGIGFGRVSVWRWYASPEVKHQLTAKTALDVIYQASHDAFSSTDGLTTHAVDVTLSHQLEERHEARVKALVRQYVVGGHNTGTSEGVLVGWKARLTPFTTWSAAAGPRFDSTSVQPEIEASIVRRARTTDLALFVDRTQTTAIGVVGFVDVQRILGTLDRRLPGRFTTSFQGGAYANAVGASRVTVYRASATIVKGLIGGIAVSAAYGLDFQNGFLGVALPVTTALADVPPLVGPLPSQPSGWVHRNLFLIRVVIAPERRTRTETPEGQPPPLELPPQGITPLDRSGR